MKVTIVKLEDGTIGQVTDICESGVLKVWSLDKDGNRIEKSGKIAEVLFEYFC